MKTKIVGLNFDITESIRNSIEKEIGKFKELCETEPSFSVELSVQKKINVCHISMFCKGKRYEVKKSNRDMYDCIFDSFDTLKGQLIKDKDKLIGSKRKHTIKDDIRKSADEYDAEEYPDEEIEELQKFNEGLTQYPD